MKAKDAELVRRHMAKPRKAQVNWRLSETARAIISEIARSQDISQGAALEIILRAEAKRRGITLPSTS